MDKVRYGVIGLGNMGGWHANSLHKKEVQNATLGAICDIDKGKLESVAKETGAPTFDTYQAMLDSKLVDAVIIATPHYFHTEIAAAAFAKGIHVLSEKPIAVSVKAARELNALWTKSYQHLKFGIMFQARSNAVFAKLRELIAAGELGEITRITWIVTDWFRSWTYYASGGWRATWAGEGGGVLINQCPHSLDMMYWVTNMIPKRVTAVASIAKTHPIEVEDEVSAILEYPNGAIGHFITSTGEIPGTNRIEIAGDRGRMVVENGKGIRFNRFHKSVQEFNRTTPEIFSRIETWDIDIPVRPAKEGHVVIAQNFTNAILKDEPLISPGTDGIKGLETGNAMLMAGLTGKPVELPMDGDAYDAFIKDLTKKYGGKKAVQQKGETKADFAKSFK